MKTLAQLDADECAREFHGLLHGIHGDTLDELVASISKAYPNSKVGRPKSISNTGEPYVEFSNYAIARNREYDIRQVKKFALGRVARTLSTYAMGKVGPGFTLYWAVKPEDDLFPRMLVEHYDDNGPDMDFGTGRKCYGDHDWVGYGVYMRLLISDKPELPET